MKLIYSLFLLLTFGLLLKDLTAFKAPLLNPREIREVHLRLNAIKSQ